MVKSSEHSQQPSASDATNLRHECKRLQEQVSFLEEIINAMPDPVFFKDRQSRFRDCNQAFADLFGRRRADILGKTTFDLFRAPYDRQNQSIDEDLIDRPEAEKRYRTTIVRPDGSERQVVIHKAVLQRNEQLEGVVGIIRDISDRKAAEAALRDSERQLRRIADNMLDIVSEADREGLFRYLSPSHRALLGFEPDSLIGTSLYDLMHPEDLARMHEVFQVTLPRRQRVRAEFRYRHAESHYLWLETVGKCTLDEHGRIDGAVFASRDISERKRAEMVLKASEANYRAIFDAANDAIFVLDIDSGAILDVNRKLCEMYDYSRAQLLHLPIEAVSSGKLPYTQENALTWVRSAVDGASRLFEWHARKKSGELFWVEVNMKGTMINGRYRALAVVRDITERKRAEAALRESENRFRQIFEQNEDPAFLLDPHSLAIFDTNSAAVQLYGYSREKLLASGLDLLLDTSELTSRDRTQAEDRATESSDVDWNTVSPIHTRDADGKAVIASLRGKVIHSQGRPCLYCTLRDITEKLRIRKERNALQAKLLQANKMTAIGTLASGIAHEINNPNNYILSNAQFLTDMWQDLKVVLREYAAEYGDFSLGGLPYREAVDDLPRLIEGMAEGAHRIKNIVTNLKDFARQDETTRHRPIDLNKAIEAALVILANKIKRHTDHFFRNLAPDLPPVMGNFQKIEQVIINLVINALQSLPGKHLGVYLSTTCETATGRVLITVRDQGEGMPEDIRNRILEPFFTTRQKIGGTGLGLSICYAIVSEHHGTLDFQSEPGRGTTVTLMLPAGNLRRQAVEKPLARPTDEHT